MPPVVGRFNADFSSFYDAVEKAEVELKSFEGGAATVQRRLNTLGDGFSGRKIIQEATLVSEAIREIGGVSKLSTDEAIRSLRTLDQGFEKMLKTGQEIPHSMTKTAAELRRVVSASDAADQSVNRITSTYHKFDGALKLAGINLDAEVRALEDLNEMINDGIPSLGKFAGAAAVVATAIGAWKFGTHIGEVSGLTKAIADGTAALKGYGDVAQEEMLARMQAIELAGVAEANWKRQAEGTAAATKAAKEHTETMQREGMVSAQNAAAMEALANQLAKVKAQREADAIAARNQWPAIEGVTERTEALTAALTRQEQSLKATMEREAARARQQSDFMAGVVGYNENGEPLYRTLGGSLETASEKQRRQTAGGSFDITPLSNKELADVNSQYDPFQRGGNTGFLARLRQLEEMTSNFGPVSGRDEYLRMLSATREFARLQMTARDLGIPGFKDGVTDFKGGLARVHKDELLVNLPKGTSVIPAGSGGGGLTVVLTQQFHGPTFGSKQEFERASRDALASLMRQSGAKWNVA